MLTIPLGKEAFAKLGNLLRNSWHLFAAATEIDIECGRFDAGPVSSQSFRRELQLGRSVFPPSRLNFYSQHSLVVASQAFRPLSAQLYRANVCSAIQRNDTRAR